MSIDADCCCLPRACPDVRIVIEEKFHGDSKIGWAPMRYLHSQGLTGLISYSGFFGSLLSEAKFRNWRNYDVHFSTECIECETLTPAECDCEMTTPPGYTAPLHGEVDDEGEETTESQRPRICDRSLTTSADVTESTEELLRQKIEHCADCPPPTDPEALAGPCKMHIQIDLTNPDTDEALLDRVVDALAAKPWEDQEQIGLDYSLPIVMGWRDETQQTGDGIPDELGSIGIRMKRFRIIHPPPSSCSLRLEWKEGRRPYGGGAITFVQDRTYLYTYPGEGHCDEGVDADDVDTWIGWESEWIEVTPPSERSEVVFYDFKWTQAPEQPAPTGKCAPN